MTVKGMYFYSVTVNKTKVLLYYLVKTAYLFSFNHLHRNCCCSVCVDMRVASLFTSASV